MSSPCSSILLFLFLLLSGATSSDVTLLLEKIKPSLEGGIPNLQLSSWNISSPLCSWRGLHWSFPCPNGSSVAVAVQVEVISIHLPASALSGSLPKELSELSSLQRLHLASNSLSGALPLELGSSPSLADLDLSSNSLSGPIPISIWNLCNNLLSLRLHSNNLSSSIPLPPEPHDTRCPNLKALDFSANNLSADFPNFITNFPRLQELDFSSNRLSGPIPESLFRVSSLQRLNLSYNNFTGSLPPESSRFGPQAFVGNNAALCGSLLGKCGSGSRISSGVIAGIVIGLMAGAVVLASISIGWYQGRKRKSRGRRVEEEEMEEEDGVNGVEGKLIVFPGGEHLTLEHVLNATGQVMEKTSYGTVYKARLADGGTIALRLLREGSCKDSASCVPVVRHLGRARHENLVPLRAFYQGKRGEKLLIYDYLHNRTLHDLLHGMCFIWYFDQ